MCIIQAYKRNHNVIELIEWIVVYLVFGSRMFYCIFVQTISLMFLYACNTLYLTVVEVDILFRFISCFYIIILIVIF